MEQRKHWWNGKWGRIARRDIFLRVSGDQWYVESRNGGADGVSQVVSRRMPPRETAAA